VNEQTVRLIGKLARRLDYQLTTVLARLYLRISRLNPRIDLTALVNDIFLLSERIKNTEVGELLSLEGQNLLANLIKDGGLSAEQQQVAQELLDSRSLNFEAESRSSIEELKAGHATAMLKLFDLMSQRTSMKEQFEIFDSQLSEVVAAVHSQQDNPEVQVHSYRFLEHFIFQSCFYVKSGTQPCVLSHGDPLPF
jgi:hypothetical protein